MSGPSHAAIVVSSGRTMGAGGAAIHPISAAVCPGPIARAGAKRKTPPSPAGFAMSWLAGAGRCGCAGASGRDPRLVLARLAQHVATAPHRLDVVLAVRRVGELLAQLADEHVDDLELRLVHAAVEM